MGGGLSAGEVFAEGWTSSDEIAAGDVVDIVLDVLPSLEITLSSDDIHLEVSPSGSAASFVENDDDFEVSVATNNPTGYTLMMGAESTDLTRTAAYSDGSSISTPTIQTLAPLEGGYTESAFTTNRWGYRIGNGNYLAFDTENTLKTTTGTTTGDSTSIYFAAKVDMSTPAGSYANTLVFVAVANYVEEVEHVIQDVDKALCAELATDEPLRVGDIRDGNIYTVRYINGLCWMTQNLRLAPGTVLTYENSNIPESYTVDIDQDGSLETFTMPADSTAHFGSADGYTTIGVHLPTTQNMSTINNYMNNNSLPTLTPTDVGAWYNYCAATAGTVCTDSNTMGDDPARYDICPKGWRLFTNSEQMPFNGPITEGSNAEKFNLVGSGSYSNGSIINPQYSYWWSASAINSEDRGILFFDGSSLNAYFITHRYYGRSVRCVRDN